MTDTELVPLARGGDRDAFAELAERYQDLVWTICRTRISDHMEAQDAAQECLLTAWRCLPQLTTDNFKGWLAKIALNKCRDYWRQKARRDEHILLPEEDPPDIPAPDETEAQALQADEAARLRKSVGRLPEKYRVVVSGYYLEEKTIRELARETGAGEKTVETRLYRGIERLRKEWPQWDIRQKTS